MRAFATAYAALADPDRVPAGAGREHAAALHRLRAAMAAHPENVSGHGDIVTDLMALSGGRVVAKTGAEGLLCLAVPERGLGIAIRVRDGSYRCHPDVALAALEQLDVLDAATREAILAKHSPELRRPQRRPRRRDPPRVPAAGAGNRRLIGQARSNPDRSRSGNADWRRMRGRTRGN